MEAIILAGGKGTRLRSVVSELPKPMAPLDAAGTPFLTFLLGELKAQGVTRVVLSVGYKAECIVNYFGNEWQGVELVYAKEDEPLGTGGALKLALSFCKAANVFVFNGDTFFDVKLAEMEKFHLAEAADLTLAAKEMTDFDRYGTLALDGSRVNAFKEKAPCRRGFINGGIYLVRRELFNGFEEEKFSFEQDFLMPRVEEGNIKLCAFKSEGYFIDIGIPEDYYRAQRELKLR